MIVRKAYRKDLAYVFRALRHPNFRLFFWGQLSSLIGTWIQIVAVSWLVYRLTDSVFLLGFTAFALNVPALLLAPFAGIAADRFDRRRLLILVNCLAMAQAVVLAVLFYAGLVPVWAVISLSVLLGIFNAFELPIRQAFLIDMVDDRKDLSNAIALNSSIFNASRLIGPAVAGLLIASFGEGICFILNALSFVPALLSLSLMRLPVKAPQDLSQHVFRDMQEGVRYACSFMPIRMLLLIVAAMSLLSGVIYALLPVFAKEIFHGGPKELGFLLSASGIGALSGAFWLAGRQTVVGLGRHVAVAVMLSGSSMMIFAVMGDIVFAALAIAMNGIAMILGVAGSNIILQTVVDEDKRGRVMSLYGWGLVGFSPLGSFAAGALAVHWGASGTLFSAGGFILIIGAIFWLSLPIFRRDIRPVYVRKGVIVAT